MMSAPVSSRDRQSRAWLNGGAAADQIAALDWGKTSLGPIDAWPQSLRTAVSLCVSSDFPATVIWGSDCIQIHNDAYRFICGAKDWSSLGQGFQQCWASTWPDSSTLCTRAKAGEAFTVHEQQLFLEGSGASLTEHFFSISFRPIRDEFGQVAGVFLAANETTQQTLSERRLPILRDLAAVKPTATSVEANCELIVEAIADYRVDLPFISVYLPDANGEIATLAASKGLEDHEELKPKRIDMTLRSSTVWPLAEAAQAGEILEVNDLVERFASFSCEPFPDNIHTALVLPVTMGELQHPFAFVLAGVNPHRPLDDAYDLFYAQLRAAITQLLTPAYTSREAHRSQKTEQALREREEQLRLALEGANAGVWSLDVKSGATFWSQEFLSLYGYHRAAPRNFKHWIASVHPSDRELAKTVFWGGLESAETEYQREFRIVHPQRGIRWILALGSIERDRAGRATSVNGINIDITERKAVEEALRESEERFRALADNMSQLAWMADPEGRVFWCNRRWYDYTGATLQESRGWGWMGFLKSGNQSGLVSKVKRFWNAGKRWEETFLVRGKDGNYRSFFTSVIPIHDDEGHLIRWLATNTDITEQRAAEQALREADRRKDEFMATLAHELRGPLAPLRNSLEVMKLASEDPVAVADARAIMERQLNQMVHLVGDLFDVSSISRGKITLRKAWVPIAAVVQQAIETCRPLMEAVGHSLTVSVPPASVSVYADSARLSQVFVNLLSNAVKFTDPCGEVSLTVEQADDELLVRVRDNGTGIPPHLLDSVFDIFSQGNSAEQAKGGLGIGLSLVKALVEMHNGSVEAHSEGRDMGSEFVVRLPMSTPESEGIPAEEAQLTGSSHHRKILVADDDRDAVTSMATMLELMGNETRVAHDGLEAIELAAAFRPDIVLLDIGMPKLNGHEVARKIREQEWGRDAVLVALTGWGKAADRRQSREAGFDSHLVKPVEFAAVQAFLKRKG